MQELGHRATGPDDAERGQGGVPQAEDASQFEPGPLLHEVLAAEDEHHVDADVVEAEGPVFSHPGAGLLVDEVRLEVEHIGVVGQRHLRVFLHFANCSLSLRWHRFAAGFRGDMSPDGIFAMGISDDRTPARPNSPPLSTHA